MEQSDIDRFERSAKALDVVRGIDSVRKCPVCGCNILIVYTDNECEYDDPEGNTVSAAWEFTWRANCICCTFEVTKDLGNPSEHGMANIEDIWHSRDLLPEKNS